MRLQIHKIASLTENPQEKASWSMHMEVGVCNLNIFLFEKHTHTHMEKGGRDKGIHSHANTNITCNKSKKIAQQFIFYDSSINFFVRVGGQVALPL